MTEEVRELVELLRDEDNCNVLDYIDDAADLIESLYAQLEQVTRERDAAVKGLARYRGCIDCARYDEEIVKTNPLCDGCSFGSKWQWRGVEVEGC